MYSNDSSFEVPESSKKRPATRKKFYQKWWGKLIIGFIFIILVFSIATGFYILSLAELLRSGKVLPDQLFNREPNIENSDLSNLVTFDDPNFGPMDAKVTIVEFVDFQCSACKQESQVVREILKDYGDKILYVFRDFPSLNDNPGSLAAAMAVSCAHEQGAFWQMHDKIFENQQEIDEAILKTYAIQIGLNSIEFGNCLVSGKYIEEIEKDLMQGYEAGVRSTPTFFINGIKVEGAIPLDVFENIVTTGLSQ